MTDSRRSDENGLFREKEHHSPALLALVDRLRDDDWQPISTELETAKEWVSWDFRNFATF